MRAPDCCEFCNEIHKSTNYEYVGQRSIVKFLRSARLASISRCDSTSLACKLKANEGRFFDSKWDFQFFIALLIKRSTSI